MSKQLIAICVLIFYWTAPAEATQVCAWIKETIRSENEHDFELWLSADGETDFFYQVGGNGIVTASMTANSPGSGTYSLHAGQPEKVWGYGSNLDPPGKIDFSVELHQTPVDIFSDASTPLLAKFLFQRAVPQSEKQAPATLARKQCTVLKSTK